MTEDASQPDPEAPQTPSAPDPSEPSTKTSSESDGVTNSTESAEAATKTGGIDPDASYDRLKALFLAIRGMPEPLRRRRLDQIETDHPGLAEELRELLAFDASDDDDELLDGPQSADQQRFARGTSLGGRYRLLDRLGSGGMGEVYRAMDLRLQRLVAVKCLRADHARDERYRSRVLDEARLALRITHPNINRVHDVLESDGELFIVMELIDGVTLKERLADHGPPPPAQAVAIGRQLCAALAAAHDRGVLHRDLKPANILLDHADRAVITDFGIAVPYTAEDGAAPTVGVTPAYTAPEVGDGGEITPRTDLFALGVTLYELFTGHYPFPKRDGTDLTLKADDPAFGAYDPSVERTVVALLQVDPAQRPATAYEAASMLPGGDPLAEALRAGRTPPPDLVAQAASAEPISRRRCFVLTGLVLGLLMLVTILAPRTFFLSKTMDMARPRPMQSAVERITEALGAPAKRQNAWQRYILDPGAIAVADQDPRVGDWVQRARSQPAFLQFERITGLRSVVPDNPFQAPKTIVRAPTDPEAVFVRVDGNGRLVRFEYSTEVAPANQGLPDFEKVFQLAGLVFEHFELFEVDATAPVPAAEITAFRGPAPHQANITMIVQVGHTGEQVSYVDVSHEDDPPSQDALAETTSRIPLTRMLMVLLALSAGIPLAYRHRRRNRADLRGTWVLFFGFLGLHLIWWLTMRPHVPLWPVEVASLHQGLAQGTFQGVFAAVLYMAFEPIVRRLWPRALIGWTRLSRGQLIDPAVGRDVLVGLTAGLAVVLLEQVTRLPVETRPLLPTLGFDLGPVTYGRLLLPALVYGIFVGGLTALVLSLTFALLIAAFRNQPGRAAIAFVCIYTLLQVLAADKPNMTVWALEALEAIVIVYVLMRFGLLPVAIGIALWFLMRSLPLSADLTIWTAPINASAVGLIVLLALTGLLGVLKDPRQSHDF